jgi:hypothetical protein
MNTTFLLMAQYDGIAVVPTPLVCRDYFSHLTPTQFMRKVNAGEIPIPVVRIEASQKAATGVHIADLASWIDARREAARRECAQLSGR